MKEFVSSVSPKGQITLPKEVRERLGVKARDKVMIRLEDEAVTILPATASLESIYQSVPALSEPLTWKEIEEIVHEEQAQAAVREG